MGGLGIGYWMVWDWITFFIFFTVTTCILVCYDCDDILKLAYYELLVYVSPCLVAQLIRARAFLSFDFQ